MLIGYISYIVTRTLLMIAAIQSICELHKYSISLGNGVISRDAIRF